MVARKPIFANKEDANAREALVLYEAKQYKKALKLVDQNLKKNPAHAELLALKGCANHQLGLKADAEPYVVKALAKEPENYLVNHLAGIYYRGLDNYAEAAKWYKAAVDHGLQNTPIYRDLALLQSQIRDYKNLRELRQKFLESQPGYRANWTAVAVAHHLNKDYDAAVKTLAKIEDIIRDHLQEQDRYEQSECVLYKNRIIAELGNYGRALLELDNDAAEIRDKSLALEYRARYLLLLGRGKEASTVYRRLIQINPDNTAHYTLLETCLQTPALGPEVRLRLYDKLAAFYPRADPPQFLPLTFLRASHPEFRARAKAYVLAQLKRGVPATFVNIKPLYRSPLKVAVIADILAEFEAAEMPQLAPPVYVWTHYFLAQHHLCLGDLPAAAAHIDKALHHSPTLVELYILKARIAKHTGDHERASAIMQEGRSLDLQDRFINSKTTKYLLRANKVDEGIDCVSLFTKLDDGAVNGLKDLHTMQANWVLIESAEAYARLYKAAVADAAASPDAASDAADVYCGLALKRFGAVLKIFTTFVNDQFDYHSYCMRRGTPRDYIDMLRWEDKIHGTPIYVRAVKGLTELYWLVLAHRGQDQQVKRKKKTKTVKKHLEAAARVESEKDDQDPFGQAVLANLRDKADLVKLIEDHVKTLTAEAAEYRFTWELAYRLYKTQLKYILAFQAVRNWIKLVDPRGKKLRVVGDQVLDLWRALCSDDKANPAIVQVAKKGMVSAFPALGVSEEAFREEYSA